jgi:hypothetical protein
VAWHYRTKAGICKVNPVYLCVVVYDSIQFSFQDGVGIVIQRFDDERVAASFRIWEILDWNLGAETGYLDRGFRDFPQSLQATAGIVPQFRPQPLPSTSFPIHYSSLFLPFGAMWSQLFTESLSK